MIQAENIHAPYNKVKTALFSINVRVASRLWWLWLLVLAIAFLVQLLTLDVLPHLQQDEAQITDYGRLALNPKSDWSVTWQMSKEKPLLLWSFIGPLIAELGYKLSAPSGTGPRILALIGGMAAATITLGWLLARRVPVHVAFGLSLAFLLDPLFVLSQRMARVDSWVMLLCLGSCWLLRVAVTKEGLAYKWRVVAAGSLAAAAALVWPSAVFLYPLIVLELLNSNETQSLDKNKLKFLALKSLNFCIGGVIVLILLLLPVWQNMLMIFADMANMVNQNVDSSKTLFDHLFVLFNHNLWFKLVKAFVKTFSPLFPLLALASILLYREKGLVMVTVIALTIIFSSLVYEFRVLYLIPYFIAISGGGFIKLRDSKFSNLWLKRSGILALGVLITWSVGISLIIRTALGLEGKVERDQNKIIDLAASSIGYGNFKVFLGFTYEFYFVGRSLGWKIYTPYIKYDYTSQGNWIRKNDYYPRDKFLKLLSEMDYAVFGEGSVSDELAQDLDKAGLKFCGTSRIGKVYGDTETLQLQSRNSTIFLWFLQGKESYGSYVFYARDKNSFSYILNSKPKIVSEANSNSEFYINKRHATSLNITQLSSIW